MTAYSFELAAVAALLVASLGVRAVARNRHVRRRQRLTILLSLVWIAVEAGLAWAAPAPELAEQIRALGRLALVLGFINFAVVSVANPLRVDRAPEHFPVILQDTVIVAVFALVATAVLRERVLALSAVGAVVIGFALQDTLGNAFAGLAIQTEKPFNVGEWIRVAGSEGRVAEITWRATKLQTKDNSFLIVPNNVMSREVVLNFSEPVLPTRISVDVGAAYEQPPNVVKAALLEAVANAPLALADPPPDVLVADFGDSAVLYRTRFWVEDYGRDEEARDQVRSSIWYTFRRRGIEIPWPIQIQYERQEGPSRSVDATERFARALAHVDVFASLDEPERHELATAAIERLFAAGEAVARQGSPGSSMFVVVDGEVEVVLEPQREPLAVIGPGGFVGEMSLLAGAPRSATVRAMTESVLMEINAHEFRRFVLERPHVLETITAAAGARREALNRSRDLAAAALPAEGSGGFLAVVRRFLRLE